MHWTQTAVKEQKLNKQTYTYLTQSYWYLVKQLLNTFQYPAMKMLYKRMFIDTVIPKALTMTLIYLNAEPSEKNLSRPC